MTRLLGIDIPGKKKIAYSLRYLYGIGSYRAKELCNYTGINAQKLACDLNEVEINKLTRAIQDKKYLVEGDLRREILVNVKRIQGIRCYRGLRYKRGLPVRGQRTKTNARTSKLTQKIVVSCPANRGNRKKTKSAFKNKK